MPLIRPLATVLAVITIAGSGVSSQETAVTTRIIEEDIRVRLPLLPCTVPSAAVGIAVSLPVPLGIELVPERAQRKGRSIPSAKMRSS
jgi:hypothetical protein